MPMRPLVAAACVLLSTGQVVLAQWSERRDLPRARVRVERPERYEPRDNEKPADTASRLPRHTSDTAGRLFGVFVGIGDYDGEDDDLEYTADDARNFRQELVRRAGMLADDSVLLLDGAATRSAFRRALSGIAARASTDDLVIVFFSGHGDRVARTSAQAADPDGFDETLTFVDGEVTDDEMNRLLEPVRARLLLVLDACYSGGFSKDVISAPRRMGLFSSEEDVISSTAEELRAGGYLARFIREAVGDWRADADRDGAITAIELSDYLHARYRDEVATTTASATGRKSDDDPDVGDQHLVVDRGSVRPRDVLFHAPRYSGKATRPW
ncbi:MAG TPA: caspase family protein [Vicinamibacterales bacterium]|nr:caspase family protein [Vicinamibacterales bacterium]